MVIVRWFILECQGQLLDKNAQTLFTFQAAGACE